MLAIIAENFTNAEIACGALAGAIVLLWRIQIKSNDRQTVRADKCEERDRVCQEKNAELNTKVAVLEVQVGHMRENISGKKLSIESVTPAVPIATETPIIEIPKV